MAAAQVNHSVQGLYRCSLRQTLKKPGPESGKRHATSERFVQFYGIFVNSSCGYPALYRCDFNG